MYYDPPPPEDEDRDDSHPIGPSAVIPGGIHGDDHAPGVGRVDVDLSARDALLAMRARDLLLRGNEKSRLQASRAKEERLTCIEGVIKSLTRPRGSIRKLAISIARKINSDLQKLKKAPEKRNREEFADAIRWHFSWPDAANRDYGDFPAKSETIRDYLKDPDMKAFLRNLPK